MPFVAYRAQERRQQLTHVLGAHPRVEGEAAGDAQRIEALAELDGVGGRRGRPELDADRVVHAGEELDVRAVELPRALADPEQVRGAVVPVAGQRVPARQPLLVVEQQTLVARVDVDLVEAALVREVDPARGHERERALDLAGEQLVALPLGRARDEILVPQVHLRQVGVAALRERAQQVQRLRRTGCSPRPFAEGLGPAPRRSARRRAPCGRGSSAGRVAFSVGSERGFVNWPAIRPTFTTGSVAP